MEKKKNSVTSEERIIQGDLIYSDSKTIIILDSTNRSWAIPRCLIVDCWRAC